MAKKFKAKAKVVNKLTRDGIAEQNLATGEKKIISQKEESINLSKNNKFSDFDFKETNKETKTSVKKSYGKRYHQDNSQNNTASSEFNNNGYEDKSLTSEVYNSNKFENWEVKESNVSNELSQQQDKIIEPDIKVNKSYKNISLNREHESSLNDFKNIQNKQKFNDNSEIKQETITNDEKEDMPDKPARLQFSDNRNSLNFNRKIKSKAKMTANRKKLNTADKSNLMFSDSNELVNGSEKTKEKEKLLTDERKKAKQKRLMKQDRLNTSDKSKEKSLNADMEVLSTSKLNTADKSNLKFSDSEKTLNNDEVKAEKRPFAEEQKKLNVSHKFDYKFTESEKTLNIDTEVKIEQKPPTLEEKLKTSDKSNLRFEDSEKPSSSNEEIKTEKIIPKSNTKYNIFDKTNLRFADSEKTPINVEKADNSNKDVFDKITNSQSENDKGVKSEIKEKPPTEESKKSLRLRFFDDEKPLNDKSVNKEENPVDKKLEKLEKKAEKINTKLENAQKKLPAKRVLKAKRVFDENKQKPKIKLQFEKEVKPPGKADFKPVSAVKFGANTLKNKALNKAHQKINEVEDENVSVKATHKAEQTVENYARFRHARKSALRFSRNSAYRKVNKLEEKAKRLNFKHTYEKTKGEAKKKALSKYMQKRNIKKKYAKAARNTKKAAKAAKKTASVMADVSKKAVQLMASHPVATVIIILLFLLVFIIYAMFNLFSSVSVGSIAPVISSSYTASDTNIDKAELAYTEWETDLLKEARNAPNTHPGYDEYKYNFGDISHNPYELMAYLTVKYQGFEFQNIEADLKNIFNEQYKINYSETIETRQSGIGETYEWKILTVTITAKSFTDVIYPLLDSAEKQLFEVYMLTKGNRQYMDSPVDFNWISNISSNYGYRTHPTTGGKDYHKGVDISVPVGTDILAGHDGVVSTAAYSSSYGYYVVIDGENGLQSKYAHCDSLLVSIGQSVKKGDAIAKSGNTGEGAGPHLHLEILKNGEYLNPLYFVNTLDTGESPVYGNPGSAMGDGSLSALIAEAEKYLGYPYVFGGSSPSTSFDCSGFVCWVYTHSGVHNLPRTTAQGIYNQCTPVSESEARPGDLIFFTKTYSTTNTVTHVGIYVGNGQMIHCGDPISYSSINSRYNREHFFSFGRLN